MQSLRRSVPCGIDVPLPNRAPPTTYVFTARCYAERSIATASRPSVRLSVCDVDVGEVSWPHRLEYFEK